MKNKNPKILAIIPARGGSKGLKNKNILPVLGKPLILYTVDAAVKVKIFDEICVCTDNEKILNVVTENKVKKIKRPKELAKDNSLIEETIQFVLHYYANNDKVFDLICLLQPTSPLRTSKNIKEAISLFLNDQKSKSLFSVTESIHHPQKGFSLIKNKYLKPFKSVKSLSKPRQKLLTHLDQNGAIYITFADLFSKRKTLYNPPCLAYKMPSNLSIDIDTKDDLKFVEIILRQSQSFKGIFTSFECKSIIVIVGSPFQGKSIISAKLSHLLNIYTVINTDSIRNTLRAINFSNGIEKSTSELNRKNFAKQRNQISTILYKLLKSYSESNEKIIIEGIHLSKELLSFILKNGGHVFSLNNKIDWNDKLILRSVTSNKIKILNRKGEMKYKTRSNIDKNDVFYYLSKIPVYEMIYEELLNDCIKLNVPIISFSKIDQAVQKIINIIKNG